MREKDIETWLKAGVEKLGGLFLKFISLGNDGVPDRIAIFPDGRIVFVELKTRRGRLSAVQEYQIDRLIGLHQQVCVVYGQADAEAFLQDMQRHVCSLHAYNGGDGYDLQR